MPSLEWAQSLSLLDCGRNSAPEFSEDDARLGPPGLDHIPVTSSGTWFMYVHVHTNLCVRAFLPLLAWQRLHEPDDNRYSLKGALTRVEVLPQSHA